MFDVDQLKQAASGRWLEILSSVAGVSCESLDGKNHPCPKCGGIDRFRMIDEEAGALFCNQCFNRGNGDGIAAVMWLNNVGFREALKTLSEVLGVTCDPAHVNLVSEMAWRKSVNVEALKDFGAVLATRNESPVCRVPMFDADMQKVGDFDMAPGELEKGKSTRGSKLGLFVATKPVPGDLVVVVEGVKDAAALRGIGVGSIGLPTCRMDASFARFFRGCHVVIIPDRDKAGLEGCEETASRLYGVAATVKIAELPAEYKETGGADVRDVLKTKDGTKKVSDAILNAKPWAKSGKGKDLKFISLADSVIEYIKQEDQTALLVSTGLPDVDRAIGGGVLAAEMIIVGGRPSHGKTMAAMQMLDAFTDKMPALIISEEMSWQALSKRTIQKFTDLEPEAWSSNRDDLLSQASRHFVGKHPTVIVESAGTVERAVEAIERAKIDYGIGAVVVDYVQAIRGHGNGRYEQISDVSTRLKQAAVQFGVILVAVCQLNRQVEARQGGKGAAMATIPRMSDLRDSGQLEQDADLIFFVEWLHRTSPDKYKETEYRIMIAKNRNRPTSRTVIDCLFRREKQKLFGVSRQSQPEAGRYSEFDDFE